MTSFSEILAYLLSDFTKRFMSKLAVSFADLYSIFFMIFLLAYGPLLLVLPLWYLLYPPYIAYVKSFFTLNVVVFHNFVKIC